MPLFHLRQNFGDEATASRVSAHDCNRYIVLLNKHLTTLFYLRKRRMKIAGYFVLAHVNRRHCLHYCAFCARLSWQSHFAANVAAAMLIKQLRVTPCSNQRQFRCCQPVKQDPVRLNMAVPVPAPVATQRMRTTSDGQRLLLLQQINDVLQLVQVLTLPGDPLQISLE